MILAIPKRNCYKTEHANNPLLNVTYNYIYNTENMYVTYSVYLPSVSIYRTTYLSGVLPVLVISFISFESFLLRPECSLLFGRHFFYLRFPFTCFLSPFSSRLEVFILFYFVSMFLFHYVSLRSIFKSVLGNNLGNSVKKRRPENRHRRHTF